MDEEVDEFGIPIKTDEFGIPVKKASVNDYIGAGLNAIDRGIMQTISEPLKLYGALESMVGVDNPIGTRLGNAVTEFSEKQYPSNPNVNETFQNVGQGLGQGVAMMATAGTSSAPGLASQTVTKVPGLLKATGTALKEVGKHSISAPGAIGGSMVAAPEWQAAKDAGLDDEDAFRVLVKNYFIGLTESIPITDVLSRLNKATGGKIMERIKIAGISALEEATQEAFQQYATNKVAQGSYDPKRDPIYQVLESAKVGGIVGLIIPSVGSTVTGHKTPAKIEEKLAPIKAAEEAKPETEISPEIDAKVEEVINSITNDQENSPGIQGNLEGGKEPIQENTNEVASPEETKTSGIFQKTGEEVVPLAEREDLQGFITGHGEEAVSQIAEFAEGKFEKRSQFEQFVEDHNSKNERKITDSEANAVWDRIREKKYKEPDTSKKVKMTEVQGLKKQIQDFARGVKEGRLDAKKDINELSTKIGETLGKANITPTQSRAIINRIGKVNLLNPKKVNDLLRYTSKVASDADYADKLSEAESIQSKLKAASNSKETFASFKPALKKLANVKPENVDVDEYIRQGTQYLNSRKDVKGKAYNPANLAELTKFADNAEVANKLAIDVQAREDIGGEDTDLSKEDIDYIYSDSDEYYDNASQAKRVEITDKLRQVADYSMMGLEDKTTPIKNLPLDRLNPKQLKQFIRVADNIALNDDHSGSGGLEALSKAIQGVDELSGSPAARDLGTIASSAYNLSNILKSMYGLSKQAAKVRQATGIGPFYAGTSKAKTQSDDFKDGYIKLADSMKGDPLSRQSKIRRGIAAYLHGYDQGTDPIASFQKAKENIEESLSREQNPEEAQAIYDDFKNANSIEEVKDILKNKFPNDWKLMEYVKKHFNDIKEQQQESNKTYDNRYAPIVEDYFPRDFVNTDVKIEKEDRYDAIRPFSPSTAFSRNNQLPQNSTINLAFEQVMFDKYQDTLMDMYANPHVMQIKAFMELPEATNIFGTKENLNKFKGVIKTGINKEMGSYGFRESELAQAFDSIAQLFKNAAYVRALGSPAQFLKQSTVLINSTIRLGNPMYYAGTPTNAKIYDSFSIGQRSKRVAGLYAEDVMDNTFKLNYANKVAEAMFKTKVGLEKHVWNKVSSFVRVPDVYSAKKTWGAFFKKYFKEQYGEDVDLNDAHNHLDDPRYQQAAQYAEQIVSETQGHSSPGEAPQILTPKSTGAKFALGVFLPFSTYAFNTKARIINTSKYLATGNKAQRLEAASSMVGLLSEVAAFNGIGYILANGMLGLPSYNSIFDSMWRSMFGFDEPDKDEEKQDIFRQQVIMSNAFKDLMPITVEQQSTDYFLRYLNDLSTNGMREEGYSQEEMNEHKPFYVRGTDKGPLDGSIYAIPLKEILGNGYEVNYEDNILTVQTPNGPKDIPIDDNLESYLLMSSVLETLAMAGIGLSDINNSMERVKKEQIKQAQ